MAKKNIGSRSVVWGKLKLRRTKERKFNSGLFLKRLGSYFDLEKKNFEEKPFPTLSIC